MSTDRIESRSMMGEYADMSRPRPANLGARAAKCLADEAARCRRLASPGQRLPYALEDARRRHTLAGLRIALSDRRLAGKAVTLVDRKLQHDIVALEALAYEMKQMQGGA